MSNDWTYETPDPIGFQKALLHYLRIDGHKELVRILSHSELEFNTTQSFGHRSYSFRSGIVWRVPLRLLEQAKSLVDEKLREKIIKYADALWPRKAGYDVYWVEFIGSLSPEVPDLGVEFDIDHVIENLPEPMIVPSDFKDKMKEMAEGYSYLYLIENSLRLFILKVIEERFGNQNLSNLRLLNAQNTKINDRKRIEGKIRWLRTRGDSDIYYLDFIDILSIIRENWDVFRQYFDSLQWISVKLEEMKEVRNIVAHNGYLGETEKNLIKTNFEQIIRHIQTKISDG